MTPVLVNINDVLVNINNVLVNIIDVLVNTVDQAQLTPKLTMARINYDKMSVNTLQEHLPRAHRHQGVGACETGNWNGGRTPRASQGGSLAPYQPGTFAQS